MYQEKTPLNSSAHVRRARTTRLSLVVLSFVVLTLTVSAAPPANAADAQPISHNTPRYVATSKNLGTEDPAKTIEVTIWLNLHNRAALDAIAEQLYDRTSPSYHHWLKNSDLARFAPTAQEAGTVREFFESHNLKVVNVGPNNMFVRARGTVSDVQTAFHVTLNKYQVRDKVIRSNDRDPSVEGAAASLVRSVSGLDTGEYEHPILLQTPPSLSTVKAPASSALAAPAAARPAAVNPDDFFTSNCFNGTETESFSTAPEYGGPLPTGTYSGNHLNLQSLTSYGCGYTPPVIATAYNLTGVYNEGYTGAGQTIAIIDWCGSPTITDDANAFSAQFGLPALTPSNFNIYNIPAPSLCSSPNAEINLDVEWSHAVAPGANINLIVPPTGYFSDVDEAEYLTIYNGLGNVISGSFGSPEFFVSTTELETESLLSELAAAYGISADFSSGDTGDFSVYGYGPTVSAPADSPWSTAVGGVSLALNSDNSIAWQAGWGNNETILSELGTVFDPVYYGVEGFYAGSGGGPSNCVTYDSNGCVAGFAKPAFQKKLAGKQRLLPDISWVADPYTGVAILISVPFQIPAQIWEVIGGTSVSCPMFSGLWAIANQESVQNGGPALGQAAPYLYSLPAGAIYDVVPVGSSHNVTAKIVDSTGTTAYNAGEVLGGTGDAAPGKYVSAIWDYPLYQNTAFAVSFGTDCSVLSPALFGNFDGTLCNESSALHTKVGWDNVTGVGTPSAQAFADSFNPANAAAAK